MSREVAALRTYTSQSPEDLRESGREKPARGMLDLCRTCIFSGEKVTNHLAELHEFRKLGRLAEISVCAESLHVLAVALESEDVTIRTSASLQRELARSLRSISPPL